LELLHGVVQPVAWHCSAAGRPFRQLKPVAHDGAAVHTDSGVAWGLELGVRPSAHQWEGYEGDVPSFNMQLDSSADDTSEDVEQPAVEDRVEGFAEQVEAQRVEHLA
jgi:hypothetical protein